jgi:hypothetical protein
MRISAYAKTIVALVVAIVGQDDVLTSTDIVQMVLGVLTALGVYAVPNGGPAAPVRTLREDEAHGPYGEKL